VGREADIAPIIDLAANDGIRAFWSDGFRPLDNSWQTFGQ
jgi:hypothetical protein